MVVKEIQAKSILRKHKKVDSWFVSRYGMNLYRGCEHNCVYCDGRAEKYNVDGVFGKDIVVKTNAINLLKKELDSRRKRIPLEPGYIMIGGGVGDSYQPIEKRYNLTRQTLELLYNYDFPVHILTKSTLVEQDLDIIKKINEKTKAVVSFSFSSVDDKISSVFEPGVPSPTKRLSTIKLFKSNGISCGMFLMPVIPFITDNPQKIEESVRKAKEADIDFIIFSGMTLKQGRQKDYFYDNLRLNYPNLLAEYNYVYKDDKWGSAIAEYYESIHKTFSVISKKYKVPVRMPSYLFKNFLSQNDLVVVILEQIDYILKMNGKKSPYSYAAYSVSKLTEPISKIKGSLRQLKGVGPVTEKIILEIINTGSSPYYEKLMSFY